MQICDVLGTQISPFESTKQEEYLNPIFTNFKIMTNVRIWLVKGKFKNQKWVL
jgi:hypothetical protein